MQLTLDQKREALTAVKEPLTVLKITASSNLQFKGSFNNLKIALRMPLAVLKATIGFYFTVLHNNRSLRLVREMYSSQYNLLSYFHSYAFSRISEKTCHFCPENVYHIG